MENVVQFPERKPVEGEIQYVSLEELFSVLTKQRTLEDVKIDRRHNAILDELRAFDVPTLRRLWDNFGEDSFCHGPEGSFDCTDVHRVLNEKGDGEYCAI